MTILFSFAMLASLVAAAPASAAPAPLRYTATAKLVDAPSGAVRIQIVVMGSRALSAAQRPKSMTVKLGPSQVRLTRRARPTMVGRRGGTWQTAPLRGRSGARARAAIGMSMTVTLGFGPRRRSIVVRPKLIDRSTSSTTDPAGTDPTGTDPADPVATNPDGSTKPLFSVPASALEGAPAFEHIDEYFLNARFTNCSAGWPNCPATAPVVQRYVHCPNGAWQYHRESSISGADIHSFDSFSLTGASVAVDGSWKVSYTTGTGANYYWEVAANGTVNGTYQYGPDPVDQLGPFIWAAAGC
jgi:hypothetical protein